MIRKEIFMRIIAGKSRGVQLKSPRGNSTRPTADRVKESLFNILQSEIADKSILDLFAGTGALGLESLSRGAKSASFVDNRTADLIRENAVKTKFLEQTKIFNLDAFSAIDYFRRKKISFDLIFCDPPYAKNIFSRLLQTIDQSNILNSEGKFIFEYGIEFEKDLPNLENISLIREISYGHTTGILIFEKKSVSI